MQTLRLPSLLALWTAFAIAATSLVRASPDAQRPASSGTTTPAAPAQPRSAEPASAEPASAEPASSEPASGGPASSAEARAPATPEAKASTPTPLLDRVALLGASATAGFNVNVDVEIDGKRYSMPVDLGDVLACARRDQVAPVAEAASFLFFTNPKPMGAMFAQRASQAEPTLVVAVDYLFWFGYGLVDGPEIESRLALLDEGLANLDRLKCPIVVGDFPDMSEAIGQMLVKRQVPSPESLQALNTRLRAWAAERPQVRIFGLAEFVERVRSRQAISIGEHTWPADRVGDLLQADKLHPSLEGLVAIAMKIGEIAEALESLTSEGPSAGPSAERPADAFANDAEDVRACVAAKLESKVRKRLGQAERAK